MIPKVLSISVRPIHPRRAVLAISGACEPYPALRLVSSTLAAAIIRWFDSDCSDPSAVEDICPWPWTIEAGVGLLVSRGVVITSVKKITIRGAKRSIEVAQHAGIVVTVSAWPEGFDDVELTVISEWFKKARIGHGISQRPMED